MHELISLTQWPSMPAPLSSTQPGEAWIWGDYVFVLQVQSQTVAQVMEQIAGKAQPSASPMDYPYSVTVYYRKDRNPHGPSSRPVLVAGLERVNLVGIEGLRAKGMVPPGDETYPIMIGVFSATQRRNLGVYDGPEDMDSVRNRLFSIAAEQIQPVGEPVKIGSISDIHGHPQTGWPALPQKKVGCLPVILFLPFLTIMGFAANHAIRAIDVPEVMVKALFSNPPLRP